MQEAWYEPLASLTSRGQARPRVRTLAELHAARREHLGQFFTPAPVARWMWALARPAMERALARHPDSKIAVLDNSAGSGRLLQFAHPDRHWIGAVEVDDALSGRLEQALDQAGFECAVAGCGMQSVRPEGFGLALINPPFSLTLQSPHLAPYACTTWGVHGARTSCLSHAYALHQALEAADVVIALLPRTYADTVCSSPDPALARRLRAAFRLPSDAFNAEGANVDTAVLVFGPPGTSRAVSIESAVLDAPAPELELELPTIAERAPALRRVECGEDAPAIEGEVTGDRTVRLVKAGRRIGLQMHCALTKAKVLNALYRARLRHSDQHRYPAGVRYAGEGCLDLEVLLAQSDPLNALEGVANRIREAGGEPQVDPGLVGFLRRRHRRNLREATPFGHWTRAPDVIRAIQVQVLRKRPLQRGVFGSPILRPGEVYTLQPEDGGAYRIEKDGQHAIVQECEIDTDFTRLDATGEGDWREQHPSRVTRFPALAHAIGCRAAQTGADSVASWGFQRNDVIELRMSRGAVDAASMGTGKTRIAIALCLMGGDHNAILVEPHLLEEFIDKLREAGVDPAVWQVIRTPEHCRALRKINLITYNRLRRPVCTGAGRRTYAALLRRRFATVCCDEAHLLRNADTEQARAVRMLSPRRRYALTGTPMANYVQDLLPLLAWAGGDGTVLQPFGLRRPYLHPRNLRSMKFVPRGMDEFSSSFLCFEWVTREFEDGLRKGAKRQVPKVRNLNRLRHWVAPLMKRRLATEPEVACHFRMPEVHVRTIPVEWDDAHLAHYLTVAEDFADWYAREKEAAGARGGSINLVALLARIGAVQRACNAPHVVGERSLAGPYMPLTSKQRAVIDRCQALAVGGHKILCYVDSPDLAERIARELRSRQVECVTLHGQKAIEARTHELNAQFRHGDARVLVASTGVAQTGLDLYQADRVVFATRSWTATQERQCIGRAVRPQQTRKVEVEFFNLVGSIDDYQAQMTAMKADSMDAAVDFLEPEYSEDEFLHLDRILESFVADLAERRGYGDRNSLREALTA